MPMNLRLMWVGKTKEGFISEGIDKYLKLLSRFAVVEKIEIKEDKGRPEAVALKAEAEKILKHGRPFILLDEKGKAMTSEGFAGHIKDYKEMDFVLGGAFGVSDEVKRAAKEMLSLSPMTLTHEMSRLVLLEQLYRAFMINTGRDYHH